MPDFQEIYQNDAERYDLLVAREDYRGNLLAAIQNIRALEGLDVVEFGAGTGRLTSLLAPRVRTIRAFDESQHMLDTAFRKLKATGAKNWHLGVADNRSVPAESESADLVIEGWSFGHFCGWYPDTWQQEVGKALKEMHRILRPGGTAILIETMGTGRSQPQPPNERLSALYRWLADEHRMMYQWIRTDYEFHSLEEAVTLTLLLRR
ncbi:MAG: class I SAM-dependent methyltransferase [Anaerolineae bacterium]